MKNRKNYVTPPITKPTGPGLSDYLKGSIISFCQITGVPVTFFDRDGVMQWECEAERKVCTSFPVYATADSLCRRSLLSSFGLVSSLGEPYIFTCRMGLVNIGVALTIDGRYSGCFIAGPLIMGRLTESTVSTALSLNSLDGHAVSKVVVTLREMRNYQPKEVSHLAMLLNNCVLASSTSAGDDIRLNKQYRRQVEIWEEIQAHKRQHREVNYPYALESSLIEKVKEGDEAGAGTLIIRLLEQIAIFESGDLAAIRNRFFGIFAVLARAVAEERGDAPGAGIEMSPEDTYALESAEDFDDLQAVATAIISRYCQDIFAGIYGGASEVIAQTIRHIGENYGHKITLQDIAHLLHVSPTYLSMLFKEEMGTTFSEYLNMVRVKKAKQMLQGTNISVVDVSLRCGFADQSYFTKVFKRAEGCTPRDYRNHHIREARAQAQ
ncbi:helix-turn-helix domain-containing protein [Ruminococcaceae bacterium OttesenSCG-928-A11]|nr:helix-turn-helix domain-containing protein [Ruminococcaceae bacterium OttesenSCG-928-A11]